MKERTALVLALLRAEKPVQDILSQLDKYQWDSHEDLAILTRRHLVDLLRRFLAGDFTSTDIEAWANGAEGRDDIGYEIPFQEVLKRCIFELATPELGQPLTTAFAQEWIARLAKLTP
jgi:hypothetical protein